MAQFKVGQRVKFVRVVVRSPLNPSIGQCGVIVGLGTSPFTLGGYPFLYSDWWDCHVHFDGERRPHNCMFAELEPTVDPRESEWADAKLEQLKRLVREPLPQHPSEIA